MKFDYKAFCKKLDGKSREEAIAEIAGKMEYFSERLEEATFSTSQILKSKIQDYRIWNDELRDLYKTAKTLKKGEVFSSKDLC